MCARTKLHTKHCKISKKTKTMLLSTSQMSHVHSLDKNRPAITISDSTLEYVNVSKLLGVHFHQHLNWDEHVQATCKSCYGTIQIIRKLKNFAGYRLRKHLVESLVLSKLDYCDTVYYPLPEFQLKRLQRVQLVAASFVLNRYVNDINDIVKIRWLPVRQRLFPTFHLRRTRSTINVHSTKTFHNLPFLLLSLILNTTNTVLRFQQQAIHMRNNDSVICLSYRL